MNWRAVPRLRTVNEEEMGARIHHISGCKIADDTLDVLGCRHQNVDSCVGRVWFSTLCDKVDN